MEKKEEKENENNKQENNNKDNINENNNNKKEEKKPERSRFFQMIKAKFNNITNEMEKKFYNRQKEKPIKTQEESQDDNKNEKPIEKNNENEIEKKPEENNNSNEIKTELPSEQKIEQKIEQNPSSGITIQEKSKRKKSERKEDFTKDELKKLYFRFHTILIENKRYDKFYNEITEILEDLAEFIIHGDKNDPSMIELFKQLNFLLDILVFLQKREKEINIQIIKFFSVLLANLSENNLNYFLMSSDYINQIIYIESDAIEGDYLYYYVNFIKALLFKINNDTLKYFFHEERNTFALLVNCLRFYNHPDSMISNTVRNIFLFVLKTGNKSLINFVCNLPMITYFVFISCRLRDEIKTLDKKIIRGKSESSSILHERICNDILYFQDIFSINIDKVNYILINCLFHFLILPTLCNSLIIKPDKEKKINIKDSFSHIGVEINLLDFTKNLIKEMSKESNNLIKDCISKELALYIFNLFFKYIKNETFLNALISVLFLPKMHYKLMEKIKTPNKDLYNYKGDYDPKAKIKFSLEKEITENYTPTYMKGLISNSHKIFQDLHKIETKLVEKCKLAKVDVNLNMAVPYMYYMEIINNYFSRSYLKQCQEYHKIISEATGIQCGLTYHQDRKCVLYLLNKNLKYIKNDFSFEKIQNKYVDNLIYLNFMNEFKQCLSLNLLLLYNYLFDQIIRNEYVNKELLSHVELLNPNLIHKNIINNVAEENETILQLDNLLKEKKEKIKSNKIQIINFSNIHKVMYKGDFALTEFNLYDNKILAKYFYNGQVEYNLTILGVILKFININEVLRPEIYLFFVKLIHELIIYEENGKKFLLKLRENHISTIKNIFVINIERIIKIIKKGKIDEKDLIKISEFIFSKTKKNFFEEYDNMINDFMENCLFLMNKKKEEKDKNIVFSDKLELYNSLDIKNLEMKIRVYFIVLIYDIYDGVYEGKIKEIEIEEIKDTNGEYKNNIKEIILNNLYKIIFKENKEEDNDEENKEDNKDEIKEENKEENNIENKEENNVIKKDEIKEENNKDKKEENKDEIKEENKDKITEEIKEDKKEENLVENEDEIKEKNKEDKKEENKDENKE